MKIAYFSKKITLSLFSCVLLGCSPPHVMSPVDFSKFPLDQYYWNLSNAETENQGQIKILTNTDIQITIEKDKLAIKGGCNFFNAGITYNKPQEFFVGRLASTLKMCFPKLMNQDQSISNFFNQEQISYQLVEDNVAPKLILTNSKLQKLTFIGLPTEEKLYGKNPKKTFIEISPTKLPCTKPSVCYQYRFVSYDEKYRKINSSWQVGIPNIKNYQIKPNSREIVRVKEFTNDNQTIYTFDMIVEQEVLQNNKHSK